MPPTDPRRDTRVMSCRPTRGSAPAPCKVPPSNVTAEIGQAQNNEPADIAYRHARAGALCSGRLRCTLALPLQTRVGKGLYAYGPATETTPLVSAPPAPHGEALTTNHPSEAGDLATSTSLS
ncbi:hypothetical protein VDGL01_12143 [Verticillium dahliae]